MTDCTSLSADYYFFSCRAHRCSALHYLYRYIPIYVYTIDSMKCILYGTCSYNTTQSINLLGLLGIRWLAWIWIWHCLAICVWWWCIRYIRDEPWKLLTQSAWQMLGLCRPICAITLIQVVCNEVRASNRHNFTIPVDKFRLRSLARSIFPIKSYITCM